MEVVRDMCKRRPLLVQTSGLLDLVFKRAFRVPVHTYLPNATAPSNVAAFAAFSAAS